MKLELGHLLYINNSWCGFISHLGTKLMIYDKLKKKNIQYKANKQALENIYKLSITRYNLEKLTSLYDSETIIYVNTLKSEIKSMKKGQKFLASDGNTYFFDKLSGLKLVFYKDNLEYTGNIFQFVEKYNEYDSKSDKANFIRTMSDYNKLSVVEKITEALNYVKMEYNQEGTLYKVLSIGNIISGYAYNHETDKQYKLIGLEVNLTFKYDFMTNFETIVGFFPIYLNRSASYDPIIFTESIGKFGSHYYDNGCGDKLVVDEILVPLSKTQGKVDISKYSNIKGLIL